MITIIGIINDILTEYKIEKIASSCDGPLPCQHLTRLGVWDFAIIISFDLHETRMILDTKSRHICYRSGRDITGKQPALVTVR